MNNLKKKIRNNVNNYTKNEAKKHPHIKNSNQSHNDNYNDPMYPLASTIAIIMVVTVGFIIYSLIFSFIPPFNHLNFIISTVLSLF